MWQRLQSKFSRRRRILSKRSTSAALGHKLKEASCRSDADAGAAALLAVALLHGLRLAALAGEAVPNGQGLHIGVQRLVQFAAACLGLRQPSHHVRVLRAVQRMPQVAHLPPLGEPELGSCPVVLQELQLAPTQAEAHRQQVLHLHLAAVQLQGVLEVAVDLAEVFAEHLPSCPHALLELEGSHPAQVDAGVALDVNATSIEAISLAEF
eukprot:CAMPEP_0115131360 /NCGR_PEP_ID=MMETSP0227-20121206/53060_1 /TAXON_ID=89957 /ORGANISM="Polarella glacialis, Strain CCMP 1383" /LENGTH=208 /DNA_ID=CAMNT_0002536845 /DNA_START=84 /DNA_END=709 /DNA_ORIENTATION=+